MLHGGVHDTGHDHIPLYVDHADTVTVQAGSWFDPATWSAGVPTAEMDVMVSHRVTINAPPLTADFNRDGMVDKADLVKWATDFGLNPDGASYADGVADGADFLIWQQQLGGTARANAIAEDVHIAETGSLIFQAVEDTRLQVQTLMVFGALEVGTADAPITASAEIVFRDAPIDTVFDPQQFGHGLLVLGHGSFTTKGLLQTPFVKVASAAAGTTTITLAAPVNGWRPGDELFLPDTRQMEHPDFVQAETVSIASVDGLVVTLTEPLALTT